MEQYYSWVNNIRIEHPAVVSAIVAVASPLLMWLVRWMYTALCAPGQPIPLTDTAANLLRLMELTKSWSKAEGKLSYGAIKVILKGSGSFDIQVDNESIYNDLTGDDIRCVKDAAWKLWNAILQQQKKEEEEEIDAEIRARHNKIARLAKKADEAKFLPLPGQSGQELPAAGSLTQAEAEAMVARMQNALAKSQNRQVPKSTKPADPYDHLGHVG